ncbi:MAG: TlpA family protein disulfide reductase [Pyrinomonadaceae bacterium]|jgi:thiol-disulfide isomerase/thioredoxin|nr:TlpA family protein disulfide reductase [Pyrinomonadaceae bacterium]
MSKENREKNHLLTPARLALTVLVLSLVSVFGISSCNSADEIGKPGPVSINPAKPAAAAAGSMVTLPPVVLDTELKAVNGRPIKLSDYAGKVLVVNLWATWCGPCRMEIPELVKFHNEFRAKGLEVVGLSTENPEASAAGVRRFVQEFKMDYPVGWATPEVAIALMQGRDAIPQSFVISRNGRILKRFIGFSAAATPQQLRDAIEEALKG